MTRFRVSHRTVYSYGLPMADGFTSAHLEPRDAPGQRVVAADLRIEPAPDEIEQVTDPWGNRVTLFAVHHPHDSLLLHSVVEVEVAPRELPSTSPPWESVVAAAARPTGPLAVEIGPYRALTEQTSVQPDEALRELAAAAFTPARPVVDAVRDLCRAIFSEFRFDPGATDVSTPLATVLAQRGGVCQDFAHVAVATLRLVGLPARYVSGYIETLPPPGQPKLVGVDASHAWCSVWTGDDGWVDFDPTNDQMPPQRHVTVGWGRDYHDVTPVRGVVIGAGGTQSLTVAVDVTAVD